MFPIKILLMIRIIRNVSFLAGLTISTIASAQFPPQVGFAGTTAIHKDSSVFVNWATGCTINRGWLDIADTAQGKTAVGDETYVPGKAGTGVVSLGDKGSATVTFERPIMNGDGFDFAVFENGFLDQTLAPGMAFLELAFVEVSSDGINFFRFPATSLNDTLKQLASFEGMDATKINNLAGKYMVNYGTPFDLEELKDTPGLDVMKITHVRIIDVCGTINPEYASRDSKGARVNDPYPTPFASGGFDLDAVGVIHQNNLTAISEITFDKQVSIYPNPAIANAPVMISTNGYEVQVNCYDLAGKEINTATEKGTDGLYRIYLEHPGIYFIKCTAEHGQVTKRIVVQ
jgi:hypothetical protein